MNFEQPKNEIIKTPEMKIKKGIDFVFEENPELANKVYEALGFNQLITSNDRIVFGHPTIGKSFLKNQGEDKFISLDDDYATEINNKVKGIADKYNVTTYQVKDGGTQKWNNEYNQMMQEMFNVAKQKAISENKTLFTSNTNLLRNNAEFFDKVINLTDKEFERRIQERGAKYDTKEWKSQINEAISKLAANKVINTDKYLSDLFITPQQKQEAQQLYSQYLDTIFPNSKIKDIVYHGSGDGTIEKFRNSHFGTYFSYSPIKGAFGNFIYSVVINAKNPLIIPKVEASTEEKIAYNNNVHHFYSSFSDPQKPPVYEYDSAIESSSTTNEGVQIKIRNPEQIHILGSKDDVTKFKEFISSKEDQVK